MDQCQSGEVLLVVSKGALTFVYVCEGGMGEVWEFYH